MVDASSTLSRHPVNRFRLPDKSLWIMAVLLLTLGFLLLFPVVILLVLSFNTAPEMFSATTTWGLANWKSAFTEHGIFQAIGNTILVWAGTMVISFPISILIAWVLARTTIPFSRGFEFMFWLAYMLPGISIVIAWMTLLDPHLGLIKTLLAGIPVIGDIKWNIYSIEGIIWVHVVANGIPSTVILLTPAFRNMDSALEEAARVSGGNTLMTMLKVTLPLMMAPMALVFALKLMRVFQTFEIEQLLGTPINFFVYSTYIYDILQNSPPNYGKATVLASLTLAIIAVIIPIQRWVLHRRRYTTITSHFKPGLIPLGSWQPVALGAMLLVVLILTAVPFFSLLLGSLMTRAGFFQLGFTLSHWQVVLNDELFVNALWTTFILASTTAIISPVLFSMLAYIMVRTTWRGRNALDVIIWISGAIPGILSGLGLLLLFLGTPGLNVLYGTIWALIIVVILQGNTTGVNISKGAIVQIGQDMEDAARISGAGWWRTYFRIWLPLLAPTLALLSMMNFVIAAGTTSSIILLASRDTVTLSLLALEFGSAAVGNREAATVISLIIILVTCVVAIGIHLFGRRHSLGTGTP